MRNPENVFHLAIPCKDLDEAKYYYVNSLGCKLARRYNDRITLNFFGDQVVIHHSPEDVDLVPKLYPRHFGITFKIKKDFDAFYDLAKLKKITFFEELKVRFKGKREEHLTFFLIDPSNNVLEFKCYNDPEMMC